MYSPEMSRKTLMVGGEKTKQARDYKRKCFNVDDFQILSKQILPKDIYEYLASGSDDEVTLNENRRAFQRWFLRPRVMRPVGKISTRATLFGNSVSMPVFISPAGLHALCDPEGECSTIQACAKAGIMFGLSQHSTRNIEEVADAAPPTTLKWYQLYILKDRERTRSLIRRAIRAGFNGLFVTVDSVCFGYREADARNGFNALPPPHRLKNYDDSLQNSPSLDQTYNSQEEKAWDQNSEKIVKCYVVAFITCQ
jgi:(S)-2-hydroxy-acid oxidase